MVNAGKLTAIFLGYHAASCTAPIIPLTAEQQNLVWSEEKPLQVQAHRGGAGMHAESTLYSFAYAIDIGADVIEMDVLFTKDRIPVVWHDFAIEADKCFDTVPGANYVGQFIANLTLANLKTLDCGSQQSEGHKQAKHRGSVGTSACFSLGHLSAALPLVKSQTSFLMPRQTFD